MKSLIAATSSFCFLCGSGMFAQTPTINRVVDGASFSTQLAPGSLANVIGGNFGNSTSIPVTVGGKACAVLSAAASQLQIQIAVDAPLGATTLQVGTSAPFNISLAQYAPVMFSADGTGQGNVQAFHGDGTPVTPSNAAEAGEVIVVPAIGMGPTLPVVPTGTITPSSPLAVTAGAVSVSVASKAVVVLFSGLTPGKIGVYQVNFAIPPDTTTGNQTISLSVGGARSNTLTLPTTNAPVVRQLQNNYSNIQPGLPNYGIAQGAIFTIYGGNLASTSTPVQTVYPLLTSRQGVSISVTVNGTTTHPILYYVTPNQVGAILPSSTSVGTGQITVTNNGQSSRPLVGGNEDVTPSVAQAVGATSPSNASTVLDFPFTTEYQVR